MFHLRVRTQRIHQSDTLYAGWNRWLFDSRDFVAQSCYWMMEIVQLEELLQFQYHHHHAVVDTDTDGLNLTQYHPNNQRTLHWCPMYRLNSIAVYYDVLAVVDAHVQH